MNLIKEILTGVCSARSRQLLSDFLLEHNRKRQERETQTALNKAVDYCIENDILRDFLLKNRAEVLGMLLEEFDVEKYERTLRREGREEGRVEGREEGIEEGIHCSIEIMQEMGLTRDSAKKKLTEKYFLTGEEAECKLMCYWK